ncbi:VirB3 family type IV secretion system protein [Pseudomonas sp. NPDC098747]|uniref:VirB3 family type IV secretion system protein n=1 Tax=Pseudomonas sp. NPDC098747 TaxID=3364487 RepID=UPI00383AC3AD
MLAKKKLLFDSYNAMSRPAMYWGIPIMPMIALIMCSLLVFGIGTAIFSLVWGLIFAFPFVIGLLALRLITSVDDRYFRRVRFGLRRLRLNLKYGKQLLLTPFNPKWSQYYGRRYSQKRYASRDIGASDALSRSRTHGVASGKSSG